MDDGHITPLQGPHPGVQVGDHLPEHTSLKVMWVPCRCPPHPPAYSESWDSQPEGLLLLEAPPTLPTFLWSPSCLCHRGPLSSPTSTWVLQQQKLYQEPLPRTLDSSVLGFGKRKELTVLEGGVESRQGDESAPKLPQGETSCVSGGVQADDTVSPNATSVVASKAPRR